MRFSVVTSRIDEKSGSVGDVVATVGAISGSGAAESDADGVSSSATESPVGWSVGWSVGSGGSGVSAQPNTMNRSDRTGLRTWWMIGLLMLLASQVTAQEFVCFVYHRFGDGRYPSTNIAVDAFRGQLQFLRQEAFTVLTLGDAMARLDAGELTGPTAVLTIDDGYDSFRTGALPLLREFDMPATLFVNSASVGRKGMLGWDDLDSLVAEGLEIGNHTASHEYFLDLSDEIRQEAFRRDLEQAQDAFAERLGFVPVLFSYPFGEFDSEMRSTVQELGFTAAVAQNSGVVSSYADRHALPRFPMGGPFATVAGFKRKARMRALPVIGIEPASRVLGAESRPWLTLEVAIPLVRWSGAQCFVAGDPACSLHVDLYGDPGDETGQVRMQADHDLSGRRTLYTITAPSASGSAWHWFSHVWIQPRED